MASRISTGGAGSALIGPVIWVLVLLLVGSTKADGAVEPLPAAEVVIQAPATISAPATAPGQTCR